MSDNTLQMKSAPKLVSLTQIQSNEQLRAQSQKKENMFPVRGRINLYPLKAYSVSDQGETYFNRKSMKEQNYDNRSKELDSSFEIKAIDEKEQSPYKNEFNQSQNTNTSTKARSLLYIGTSSSSRVNACQTQSGFRSNSNIGSFLSYKIGASNDKLNQTKIKSSINLEQSLNKKYETGSERFINNSSTKMQRDLSPLTKKAEIKSYTFLQDEKNQMLMSQILFRKPKIPKQYQNYYQLKPIKTPQTNIFNQSMDKRCNTAIGFQLPQKTFKNDKFKANSCFDDTISKESISPPSRQYINLPQISAESWSVLDANTGNILYGHNQHCIRQMASLTKMMTLYVSIQIIKALDISPYRTYVEVSKKAASMIGTSARLLEGDRLSLWDLMHGMMLPSGNDAATALAENLGVFLFYQSEEYRRQFIENPEKFKQSNYKVKNSQNYFIEEMNKYVSILKLNNTHFTNPTGLVNSYNRSTASDLAKLSFHLIKEEKVKKIVENKYHFAQIYMKNDKKRSMIFENTNKLLSHGYSGLKTGITTAAGPCLSAWYKDEQINLVIILLNSSSMEQRWEDTKNLVSWVSNEQKNIFPQSSQLP